MMKNDFYKGFKYHQDFKTGIGLKYKKVLALIGEDQSILEIGCHTGYLGEVLKRKGNRVWGVEINNDAASKAKTFYETVFVGDIEDEDLWDAINQKFDVLLFLDVLEHLVDPWKILVKCRKFLNPEGFVLVTFPNTAFYSVRKSLFLGRFNYQDSGILDKTHLRFFTFYSARQFIKDCGYSVADWHVTYSELPLEYRLPFLKKFYNKVRPFISKRFPNLFGAVILFKAIPQK